GTGGVEGNNPEFASNGRQSCPSAGSEKRAAFSGERAAAQSHLKSLDEPSRPNAAGPFHHLTLDPEREQQHRVLEKSADLALECFTPMVLSRGLFVFRRTRDPARRPTLV